MDPLLILAIGVAFLLALILVLRLNAFLALIGAALLTSLLSPGPLVDKVGRVVEAFGSVAGGVGIVIALAAVIGTCLMESGAADRITRAFLKLLGEKRASWALVGSGFVLSVPVFFDTVFYLLVPLARSLHRRTRKNYVLYLTAIVAGGTLAHTLVPPTPGPLFIADAFGVDLGLMIVVGTLTALPAAVIGMVVCRFLDAKLDIPMRPHSDEEETQPPDESALPPLGLSLLPIVLPVALISANTLLSAIEANPSIVGVAAVVGNPNLALLLSAAISLYLLGSARGLSLNELAPKVERALMTGGLIVLVTAGGGAFGAMLREAGLQQSVQDWLGPDRQGLGATILLLAFGVTGLIKFAQGSGTVAMITTASMFASMGLGPEALGFHPVYLATAIGSGALLFDWMNNSAFWIFSRMSGLTEVETLKTWSIITSVVGIASMTMTLMYSLIFPMI